MNFTPVLPPYPHQVEARDKMRGKRAFGLLMEMRTGKSKVIIDDWGEMEDCGASRDLLYVSPAGALYGEDALETQIHQHLPPDLRERARVCVWRSGGGVAQKASLSKMLGERDPRRPRILLMNVEALSNVERARETCREFLTASGDRSPTMVIGESTCIKGSSHRTEHAADLGRLATWRRIETGLVAPHSPLDLFHQFAFLDPKILRQHSWFGFRARYAILKDTCFLPKAKQEELMRRGRRVPTTKIVVAYRNQDELAELIEPVTYRKRFRDCAAAPAGAYLFRDVELTPEQARMYREFKEYATTQIDGAEAHMTATVALTQILRIHQMVCGYVVDEEGRPHDVPERRTAALLDVLEDYGGQAVIWCSYNRNIESVTAALRKRYGPEATVMFYGGNRGEREEGERRFKRGDARFMVANPAAGGKGREWSCASLMVYYSNSPNLEHRDQSEARIEAVGKIDPVTRIDLRVPGVPADARMIANLRKKIDMASALQGDGYREWLI